MKKVFLLLTTAMFGLLSANAQKQENLVIPAGDCKNIMLGDGMNVVLVHAQQDQDEIKLSREVMDKLDVRYSHGTLRVAPQKALHDVTVYVLVGELKNVTVGENTCIRTENILSSSSIDLYMSDGATAKLKTTAEVNAYSIGNFDLVVKRNPIPRQVSATIN